jgi:hypothetical protein
MRLASKLGPWAKITRPTDLCDGFNQPVVTELDLSAGITNVIWATSYKFDFSLVKLPIFDDDGYPIQTRGLTAYQGLFFVGLPWLHNGKSGLIYGVGDDAAYVAKKIVSGERFTPCFRGGSKGGLGTAQDLVPWATRGDGDKPDERARIYDTFWAELQNAWRRGK